LSPGCWRIRRRRPRARSTCISTPPISERPCTEPGSGTGQNRRPH